MEEVEIGFDWRVRQEVVRANVNPLEMAAEPGHSLGRVLRHQELPGWSEPVEPKLESSGTHSVGGEAPDAELVEPTAQRLGAYAECGVVRGRLPRVAVGGQGKRSRGLSPEGIPRLRANQIVADEAALGPEVEVVPERDRKHLQRR
jgi:hypothetical protein